MNMPIDPCQCNIGRHTEPSGVVIGYFDGNNILLWKMEPCNQHLSDYLPDFPNDRIYSILSGSIRVIEDKTIGNECEWW